MSISVARKWAYVVCVAVLLAGTAVLLTVLTPRRGPLQRADELRKAGRYLEALDQYQAVLARDPNNEDALWGVAATHVARGDEIMALDYLNQYLRKYPAGAHASEASRALAQLRGAFVERRKPSPELAPGPGPGFPSGPSPGIAREWDRAITLEQQGQLLDAIRTYAALAETAKDGRVRAAALERMARCEAKRPPFDYHRIRHYYLQAARAYRDLNDWQNASRCKELAYLAQEYARVKTEREKLAEERWKLEAERAAGEKPTSPSPQDTYQEALEAYHAGDRDKAAQLADKIVDAVPEARYILGMVHVRQGLWDDARQELKAYISEVPAGSFADEAKRELDQMRAKHPLLVDDFAHGADRWRLVDAEADMKPSTDVLGEPNPSDGPCLRLEPGQGAYTSFEEAQLATIELRIYHPTADDRPLPRTRFRLYTKEAVTCAPLLLDRGGYRFVGQPGRPTTCDPGWHKLVIDVSDKVVTAHVDARFIGEVPRERGFSGLHVETDKDTKAGPLLIDEVWIVEHLRGNP